MIDPCFVYRLYDIDGVLVYVGYTQNPLKRWQQHHHERPGMVAAAATYRLSGPYAREDARTVEAAAILIERPLFNSEITNTFEGRRELSEKYPPLHRRPYQFKLITERASA